MSDRLRGFIEKVRHGLTQSGAFRSSEPAPSDDPGVLPKGGRFLTATFTGQAGTRAYKLYIPSTYQAIRDVPGRFLVTAILVFDQKAISELDPRGPEAPAGALDEPQTARFLTNVRRLAKRKVAPILIASNEYHVVVPEVA